MAKPVVAVVGSSGTVGLGLYQRLRKRTDITVLGVPGRLDAAVMFEQLAGADVAVLCLPEKAALAFAARAPGQLRILDASPAHRGAPGWVYGLPELEDEQPLRISKALRVANPGCFATGAVLLLRPLAAARKADQPLQVAITGVGGVSCGGRKMIAAAQAQPIGYQLYGLAQDHRHLPEIQKYAGLQSEPIFMPAVAGHQQGTLVQIPFTRAHLGLSYEQILGSFHSAYKHCVHVKIQCFGQEPHHLAADEMAGSDDVLIQVHADASRSRFVLTAQFDNLGKGAVGSAEQNLKLMLELA